MAKSRDAGGYDGRANLIPFDRLSEIKQREIRSKGGKASGAARRRKADLKRTINMILTMPIPDAVTRQEFEALGIDTDMQTAIAASMAKQAVLGNVKAAEWLAKWSGQDAATDAEHKEKQADIRSKNAAADVREQQAEALRRENAKAGKAETENSVDDSAKEMAAFFASFEKEGAP